MWQMLKDNIFKKYELNAHSRPVTTFFEYTNPVNETLLLSGTNYGNIKLWNLIDKEQVGFIKVRAKIFSMRVSRTD